MKTETANPETMTWTIDPAHSNIQFGVRHMVISETKGSFGNYTLEVSTKGMDFSDAKVMLQLDVNSINTHMSDRDAHLRSADFFDAERFPVIRFLSTSFEKIDDEEYKLSGELSIREKTLPIEFKVTYGGQITDPWGNTRAGFTLQGSLNRFDYDLNWNSLMETGSLVVGKTVKLEASIELILAK
jgi:polyisoprenoid-binding protein YceI